MTAEAANPAREAPTESALRELARDLRWTWSHAADELWHYVDPTLWHKSRNPWFVLQAVSRERFAELGSDQRFCTLFKQVTAARNAYLEAASSRTTASIAGGVPRVAYFSMEFGLGEALPLYAGGLGILAGDVLKTASDLGLRLFPPAIGCERVATGKLSV